LQQGQSEREIEEALGLGRRTIRKYKRWATAQGLLTEPLPSAAHIEACLQATQPPPPVPPSSVEPYRTIVEDLRSRGVEIQAIYQRLREEHGYAGKYMAVWRFVRRLEPKTPEATVRVEVAPGKEVQVDFGYAGRMYDPVTGKVRKAWGFVMTLSWSRHQFVAFVFDQSLGTWLDLHRRAFEFFGGVPERVVLDNLKAAIIKASVEDPQVQRAYRECAEHYGFLISPCLPRRPEHKGKVEKGGVHYVKRNFLAGRDYTTPQHNIRHANADGLTWARETAGQRKHGTTKQIPRERFTQVEQAALRPLPALPFELVVWKEAKLHRDCYLVFEGAYYSAPHRFIGQTLSVRATAKSVEIYADFERLVIHTRVPAGERQTLLAHLPPTKVAGLTLTPMACLERADRLGPHTAEVVAQLLAERPVDRLRAVHRLLAQAEQHDGGKRLEWACGRALELEDVSVRTLHALLKADVVPPPSPSTPPPPPRFARSAAELVPSTGGARWN
jgi:transposase